MNKNTRWGKRETILELLSGISSCKLDFDKNKTIEEIFPNKEDYIYSLLEKIDDMIEEEKAYLSEFPPLKDEHIFYRGILDCPRGDNLNKSIDSWNIDDVVIPQFNPMFVTTDINTACVYLDENKNGVARLFRITTPEGAKLPYSKEKHTECIFPAKSNFKFKGMQKLNNLEIINLEYIP